MLSEKPKNKQKNDSLKHTRILILLGFATVAVVVRLFFALLQHAVTVNINLSGVQSVQIQDQWFGLSRLSPIKADYMLSQNGDEFVGEATFSVTDKAITETTDIVIPAETMQAFTDMLESAKLIPGPYEPLIQWTDDYPSIIMTFQTEHGVIEIFTSSQGESHVPWGATVDNQMYVIDSDVPMQALMMLSSYLKRDVLDTMLSEYNH